MIQRIDLDHFKAFERFTLYARGNTFLAGPNNAGKSTLIAALRTCARMLRQAQRRSPSEEVLDKGRTVRAHAFALGHFGLVEENLRYEFRNLEARMSIRFSSGASLTAVWPPEPDEISPFYYLHEGGISLHRPDEVRQMCPTIGIVPVLSPVDQQENVLTSEKYIRENIDGRLASRHFRNQLLLLQHDNDGGAYQGFLDFVEPWLPEVQIARLTTRLGRSGQYIDFFYREDGSRIEKELVWAGDGLQIWMQLLLHIYRLKNSEVLILDEPDVFLHPDLQRRLVRLLDDLPAQVITATHSPELLAEAQPESVAWVDKTRRRSINAPDSSTLSDLITAIGSQFNIRLARAIRAKCVLFVEGEDMKILRHIAATVGAGNISRETGTAVIPLRGFSNWERVEPFVWLVTELLEDSVEPVVVLDRDYRSAEQVQAVLKRLREVGVTAHVWERKELESYLLEPAAIARVAGISTSDVQSRLESISNGMLHAVTRSAISQRSERLPASERTKVERAVTQEMAAAWKSRTRLALCPAKEVLTELNKSFQQDGIKTITFQRLARSIQREEIAAEMRSLLLRIEGADRAS